MRSIFLRLFLGFWLTVVVALLLFLIIAITMPQSVLMRRLTDISSTAMMLYAQGAVSSYEQAGPDGLHEYLRRLKKSNQISAWLFDGTGRRIAPTQDAPISLEETAKLARQTAQTGRSAFFFSATQLEKSQILTSPHGTRYILIAAIDLGHGGAMAGLLTRFCGLLLVTGIACWQIAAALSSPILTLRRAAQRYAAGDLSTRVGSALTGRRDELGQLGRDFDTMAVRLESLAEAQKHLLGDVSHELRSPLARLVLALAVARRQMGESESLNRIEREAGRLDSLISRLLLAARLEGGLDPAQMQRVNLHHLLQAIAEDADFEARGQDRRVEYQSPIPANSDVHGVADLLRSAIENIVRNALRYTPPQSSVKVTLRCASGQAHIFIRDGGPGVPPEALADIFRPFRRVGEARDRESGGVGLGLSITARVMSLHGGTVEAANDPNGGLNVTVSIPVIEGEASQNRPALPAQGLAHDRDN